MILVLVPDLIKIIGHIERGESKNKKFAKDQHHQILDSIIKHDVTAAGEAMAEHLNEIMILRETFAKNFIINNSLYK